MNIETINIQLLKTDLNNVKNHNKKNIEAIKKSLIKFNQYKPLIVNSDYQILVGKGTYLAMKELKYKQVQVIVKKLTEQQQKQLIILDNRTSELSEINQEIVQEIFYDLNQQQLKITGYSDKEVQNIMNKITIDQMDDQTEKTNDNQITCPYCKTKFTVD